MNDRLRVGVTFLTYFLVGFVVSYSLVALTGLFGFLSKIHAVSSALVLESIGMSVRVEDQLVESFLYVQGKVIVISDLCTGWFEIALLIGAIVATAHATRVQKFFGILFAVVAGFLFNQIRIVASVMQVIHTDLVVAEFTHDVLFRLSMLVVVVGLYALWLEWVKQSSLKKKVLNHLAVKRK